MSADLHAVRNVASDGAPWDVDLAENGKLPVDGLFVPAPLEREDLRFGVQRVDLLLSNLNAFFLWDELEDDGYKVADHGKGDANEPLLDIESEVIVYFESVSGEGDKNNLQNNDHDDYEYKKVVAGDSFEDVDFVSVFLN